jgi:hypothetical protein
MNCLEFRRQLLIDPLHLDEAAAGHEAECTSCAAHAREVRAQEVKLRALLMEVTPPEGMADRIQLAAHFEANAETRRRWWYSAAAGLLLAIGVSMVSVWTTALERGDLVLAQSVIHHIQDEASHLREAHPVSSRRIDYVFDRFGARLTDDIGPVHFAAECLMRERNGIHLVLPGTMGAITVFLMPGEMIEEAMPVRSERFEGQIVPTRWGSIAVVGESGEPIDGIGARLAALVQWSTDDPAGSALAARRLISHVTPTTQKQDT